MSEITGAWVDEAEGMLTLNDILVAKAFALRKTIMPLRINGHEFYIFPVDGDCRAPAIEIARQDWYDYYRAQRTLRQLRLRNSNQFGRFWKMFYDGRLLDDLRREYPDGRFTLVGAPLAVRLKWYKLKKRK